MINTFNKGDLFSSASGKSSFKQIANTGDAKTRHVKSVTGDTFGTNSLLKVKKIATTEDGNVDVKDNDFKVSNEQKQPPPREEIGNVILPPGSNPEPVVDKIDDKRVGQMWLEHQKKRREYIDSGHTQEEADQAGL